MRRNAGRKNPVKPHGEPLPGASMREGHLTKVSNVGTARKGVINRRV